MDISFTNFYPLERLTPIIIKGSLNLGWNKHYSSNIQRSRIYPDEQGCGQTLIPPKLFSQKELPDEVSKLSETARGVVYVLTSISYPILYVGISAKNLSKGLFGEGRISHHLRKIFAIHHVSTSHTQGWQRPAICRYKDRVAIQNRNDANFPFSVDMSLVGSDLQIAFGYNNSDDWNPEDYEGTVFDYFENILNTLHPNLAVLNSKKMNRMEANIVQPANLDTVLNNFGGLDLSDIDHSLNLKIAAQHYSELINKDPSLSALYIATISKVFKILWENGWSDSLREMAQEWEKIDNAAELALEVALYSSAKPQFYREFIEILDIYVKATQIYMKDFDGQGEWKLQGIDEILKTSKLQLSK